MKKLMFWLGIVVVIGSSFVSVVMPSLASAAADPVATAAGNNTGTWNNAFSISIGPYTFLDESLPDRTNRPAPSDTFVIQNPPTRACAPGGGSHVGDDTDYITNPGSGWILHYWTFSQIAGNPAGSCSGEQTKSISVAPQTGTQGAYFVFSDPSTITTGNGRRIYNNTGTNTYTESSSDLVGNSGSCQDVITLNKADIVNGTLKDVANNAGYVMRTSNVGNNDSLPASISTFSNTKDASGCYYAPSVPITVTDVQNGPTSLNPASPTATGGTPAADPCATAGGAYAWVLCPLVSKVGGFLTGTVYSDFIQPLLQVNPLNSGQDASLRSVSGVFVNLADVIFVIVFLIMIFGTSLNIDSYTVKKTLPRLVVAAIAIQFSYFLCGLVVDIGNVLGAGIEDLVITALNPGNTAAAPLAQEIISTASTAFLGTSGVIAIIAAGAAAYVFLGPMVLLLVLGLALSVIIFFFTLILRQLLISIMIVLAPVAIVAWILPNTQNLFKKWWQNFIKIIMVYPIISLMLASALLFQRISGSNGFVAELASGIAPIVIFFMMPMAFKWGGSLMNLAGKVAVGSGLGAGARAATNAGKQPFKDKWKQSKDNFGANSRARTVERAGGTGFGARMAKVRLGGFATGRAATMRDARVSAESERMEKQEQEGYAREFKGMDRTALATRAMSAGADSPELRAAVAEMGEQYDTKGLEEILKTKFGGDTKNPEWQRALRGVSGDVKAKAPHLYGSSAIYDSMTGDKLSKLDETGTKAMMARMKEHKSTIDTLTAPTRTAPLTTDEADKLAAAQSATQSFAGAVGGMTAGQKASVNDVVGKTILAEAPTSVHSSATPALSRIDPTTGKFS